MTVFILHAPQDLEAAEAIERFLERRGHFAELQDGEGALRPVTRADIVLALISKDSVFSPWRLRFEQRALEAWAENRLVLIKLDKNFAPIGLRDLPYIDASFEAQREPFIWLEVEKAIREKLATPPPDAQAQEQSVATGAPPSLGAPAPSQAPRSAPSPQRRRAPTQMKKSAPGWIWALWALLALPGLGALAVASSIWLANHIGPTPGTFADTVAGVDALGVRYGLAAGVTPWLFAGAIGLTGLIILFALIGALIALFGAAKPASKSAPAPAPASREEAEKAGGASAPAAEPPTFVSYARANSEIVMPVIHGAEEKGRKFWLDTANMDAGESWAGEIVRAIRTAEGVLVMCSNAAFESDHVKREVYLADRYKKRLLPVFIEEVAPPEDFEYFFAGVQWLKLHETPEAERPAALLRALGTA